MREWRDGDRRPHPRAAAPPRPGDRRRLGPAARPARPGRRGLLGAPTSPRPVIRKLARGRRAGPRRWPARSSCAASPPHVTDGLPDRLLRHRRHQLGRPVLPERRLPDRGHPRRLDLLAPGGALFVGDVRDLRSARAFQTGDPARPGRRRTPTRRALAGPSSAASPWRRNCCVDPACFATLGATASTCAPSAGRHHNELTRYRYDVVLYAASPRTSCGWHGAPATGWVGPRRSPPGSSATGPGCCGSPGVPDARTVGRARRPCGRWTTGAAAAGTAHCGVEPEDLRELGDGTRLPASSPPGPREPGRYDAVFVRGDDAAAVPRACTVRARRTTAPYANTPAAGAATPRPGPAAARGPAGSGCPTTWCPPPSWCSTGCR